MSQFGTALKTWRQKRRLSQLDLAMTANVSARHISFLETGRARPSQPMVMMLARHLDLPREIGNQMLAAAGFAPAFVRRQLSDAEMTPAREAIAWMLDRHAPYPGFALDRHWTLTALNPPAESLLGAVGLAQGDNLLAAYLGNPDLQASIVNMEEVAAHTLTRLRLESAHFGGDPVLENAMERLPAMIPESRQIDGPLPPFLPAILNVGGQKLSFFSTLAQFGSAEDIALSELRIELLFPADDATKQVLTA